MIIQLEVHHVYLESPEIINVDIMKKEEHVPHAVKDVSRRDECVSIDSMRA